jgi:hypothetical protein
MEMDNYQLGKDSGRSRISRIVVQQNNNREIRSKTNVNDNHQIACSITAVMEQAIKPYK